MSSPPGRHRRRRRQLFSGAAVALAIGGGIAVAAIPQSASAAGLGATFTRTADWGTGYSARYEVTNTKGAPDRFTLVFDLPAGARLTSLWNAAYQVSGPEVTVTPAAWQPTVAPGASVDIGFVVSAPGGTADPSACRIDGADCSTTAGSAPAPGATTGPPVLARPTPPTSPAATSPPTSSPAPTPSSGPSSAAPPAPPATAAGGRFAPYVDTSLYPTYDLLATAKASGVKDFTLAFVDSGGGCTPKWGGITGLTQDGVPGQIGALRALGGDARVSFGGANGTELAQACTDATSLAAAYGQVVSAYGLSKLDFDIEGAGLADTAANTRRAQAVAQLQHQATAQGRTLDVSFTLPTLPSGLTQDGVNLLTNAKSNGVAVGAVNVMAMDYGDGAAPNPAGKMGEFAIDAATATQAQVKSVLGLSDADAWGHVAVTPMIGVNDTASEVFTVVDARQLVAFAAGKHLAGLGMWSAARDQPCAGGAAGFAQPICSSIDQQPLDFTGAFAAF